MSTTFEYGGMPVEARTANTYVPEQPKQITRYNGAISDRADQDYTVQTAPVLPEPGTADASEYLKAKGDCTTHQNSYFFAPIAKNGEDRERKEDKDDRERRAKRICEECSLVKFCLDHAINTKEPFGIWGGLNEKERRAHTKKSKTG